MPEAVTEFEAAVAINPNIADLHLALGRNYRATLQFDKAITEFSKANALNPTDYMPELLISRTYAQNGDYAKAIQYGEAAVADAPTNPMLVRLSRSGLLEAAAVSSTPLMRCAWR